jgi:hypothetical protein
MNQQFIKVRSIKDIIIFSSFILVGFILTLLSLGTGVTLAGYIFIIIGVILALILKSAYREVNNPGTYYKKELFFEPKHKQELIKVIKQNPANIDLSDEGKGLSIRLDLYYSRVSQRAFLQLFEYVPYEYIAVSEVTECDREDVKHIVE